MGLVSLATLGATLTLAKLAHAQYGGGMMPGGGMGAPPGGGSGPRKDEKEGPAEQAPETAKDNADLDPVGGYAYQEKRRTQLIELDGYFRARADYMSNFFLSQGYAGQSASDPTKAGLPPFPVPTDCDRPTGPVGSGTDIGAGNCGSKGMGGANLRLRLEPTLNVSDQVRVHAQVDVLDNTIMGSTPDSLAGLSRNWTQTAGLAPSQIFTTTQNAPEVGQNGYFSSVRAKRAWGEIDTEYGSLRFGRMPWHFGRGIAFNDGSCMDCDGGTTVDRLMALSELYGHQVGLAWDWAGKGLTSNQTDLAQLNPNGYPLDLSQKDDVFQAMAVITKIDPPVQLRERLDRGEVVTSYGLQLVYRSQESTVVDASSNAQACGNANSGATVNASGICSSTNAVTGTSSNGNTPDQVAKLTQISARLIQPNLWFKLQYRALTVEFEGTAVLGHMDHGGNLAENAEEPLSIRQWAGVLASELRLYHDAFFLGFEVGAASGDQAEDKSQYLNVGWRNVRQPAGDTVIRDFRFSPDYHVDQIFFRQIMGTVTNAVYIRPAASYWVDLLQGRQVGFSGNVVYSAAQVPVSTPGNELNYGLETNVGVNYRNTQEGFFAGFTWGVFWPFGALNRSNPQIWPTGSISEGARDAKSAQILRGNLGIRF